jgi:hypothetical protein
MRSPRTQDRHTALGWIMLAGGALMLLFWSLYVTGAMDLGQGDPLIAAFEAAFILADSALGFFLCSAGWMLLRRDPRGPYLMVIAAAMSLYLGLLDLAFYARVGLYVSITGAAVFEMMLNAICIVGGAVCLRHGWKLMKNRDRTQFECRPDVFPLRSGQDLGPNGRRDTTIARRPESWIGGAA